VTWRLACHDSLPSTQDAAIAAAQNGEGPFAILAARQPAGRGREGRVWRAPEGNLNLSLLLRPGPIPPVPARWSLLAGLAVHDAAASVLPSPAGLMLKWPNDLLLAGAKLAGVLIDSALTPEGQLDWVVIGIGVNIAEAPPLPDRVTTCLADHGARTTPQALATHLLAALDQRLTSPLEEIRENWLARAHPPGTRLRARQGGHVIGGVFQGLAPDGSLLLQGHPPLAAGDVALEASDAAGG
jgi:BirA family biotin operon repressor/biotin-[acetyl-CoA-carboxylase] ligase